MAGPNNPEFLGEGFAEAFTQAQYADEEPTDVEKTPPPEDGDQPVQGIVEEQQDLFQEGGTDV
jgi:hypothetical protein